MRSRMVIMSTAFWDIESRSIVALEVAGASRYAGDPSTEILCVAYAIDDGEPKIWLPGDPLPEELFAVDEIVAHNFAFERPIAARILTPRHRWPEIPLAKQRCSMSLALAHALPAALDKTTKALGLPYQKDAEGYRLMRQMSRPRKAHKNEDPDGIYWVDSPEKRERLQLYLCATFLPSAPSTVACRPCLRKSKNSGSSMHSSMNGDSSSTLRWRALPAMLRARSRLP